MPACSIHQNDQDRMAISNVSWGKGRSSALARTNETVSRRLSGHSAAATCRASASGSIPVTRPHRGAYPPGQPAFAAADFQHVLIRENGGFDSDGGFRSLRGLFEVSFLLALLFLAGGLGVSAGSTWTVTSAGEMTFRMASSITSVAAWASCKVTLPSMVTCMSMKVCAPDGRMRMACASTTPGTPGSNFFDLFRQPFGGGIQQG